MKSLLLLTSILFLHVTLWSAQTAVNPPTSMAAPDVGQNTIVSNDPSGKISMKGTAQIQDEIATSLQEHSLSGVDVKVTDTEIDLSGKAANKAAKSLAHDIAVAYSDGRKVHDHVKD